MGPKLGGKFESSGDFLNNAASGAPSHNDKNQSFREALESNSFILGPSLAFN